MQGERLSIALKSIEHNGMIIPIELAVYDNDGQEGIFIPKSMEVDAAKEVGANMGSSLNSSINISSMPGHNLPPTWEKVSYKACRSISPRRCVPSRYT